MSRAKPTRSHGNTVIVWDLLFGTWFLPNNRDVEALGLRDTGYPSTFLGLMRAPFGALPLGRMMQGMVSAWPCRLQASPLTVV